MRYKIVYVSPFIFIEYFKHGTDAVKVVSNALPEDSKYIRSFCDDHSGWGKVGIVVESSEFDDLKEGEEIPVIEPFFEKK